MLRRRVLPGAALPLPRPPSALRQRVCCRRPLSSSTAGGGTAGSDEAVLVSIGGIRAAVPAGDPPTPELVPRGYLRSIRGSKYHSGEFERLPQETIRLLRWLIQKQALGEDVFLLGPPGPARRHAAMCFAELFKREVEVVSISADTTESDLKQRREIVSGDAVFVDQAPVRAALHGRLLLLEGIERAERNVLPTLNNLLEAREMALEDGRTIVAASTWDKMVEEQGLSGAELSSRGICRAHPDFMAIAIGLPVPPFAGRPLDPPLRSRFQGIATGPMDAKQLMDSIVAEAPDINMTEAASLVEFSESVFSLARSGAAGGETGEDGQSWTVGPRASLAFQQDRLLEAAQLLETFPALSGTDALARVLPALSGVGAGTLVGGAIRDAAENVLTQRGADHPGYTATSTDTIAGAEALAAVQFDAVGASEGEVGVRLALSPGPELLHRLREGRCLLTERAQEDEALRGYVALEEPHGRVITEMMQDWAMGRDTLLLSPAGAGKSRLVVELCNRLGWGTRDIKVFPLFRDVSARDLLQTRDTDENGDTVWVDSPLVAAAKAGTPIVLDNLHAARADVALGSLSRLLVDREVELPDGTLLKAASRMPLRQGGAKPPEAVDAPPVDVHIIPDSFRVLALGTTDDPRNPLSPDVAALFSLHSLTPLTHRQMGELGLVLYPGSGAERVKQLVRFGKGLASAVESQQGKLSDAEARSLQLSLRLFCRLCRFLQAFPEASSEELCGALHDGMLTPFMPAATRQMIDDILVEVGLATAKPEEEEGGHEEEGEAATDDIAQQTIEVDEEGRWLRVRGQTVPVAQASRPELVPAAANFFRNTAHDALLATMLQAHAAGERALLLIGSQGVGKNRLADKLIAMLGREREYIQLHRDSTLSSLTLVPSLEDGQIVWQDSPLVRAARHGRILLVDEADKAPLEVVALLKQLVEDGSVLLGNGQRLSRAQPSELEGDAPQEEGVINIHPDFAVWVLANPAGFPFLGNDLFAQCGDVFRTVVVHNPDRVSEVQILMEYAPSMPVTLLSRLAAAFADLRDMHAKGQLTYPYSLREAVATAKHVEEYPATKLGAALAGVLSFDSFDGRLTAQLAAVFHKHEINIGYDVQEVLELRFEREDGTAVSAPKTDAGDPKHGKVDPDNNPHVGGNTWAGGTGGSDTAGLGGRGGPYRVDAGHPVHQISDEHKSEVLREAEMRAKAMGREAMAQKLEEIGMGKHHWNQYEEIFSRVGPAIRQLKGVFDTMETKRTERSWARYAIPADGCSRSFRLMLRVRCTDGNPVASWMTAC